MLIGPTEAGACSIIYPGVRRMTADADVVAIVRVVSVGPSQPTKSDNPFVPTSQGEARAVVTRQLTGAKLPRELTIQHWSYLDEESCGISFEVTIGAHYYVWLRREGDRFVTDFGAKPNSLGRAERNRLEEMLRQPRSEWPLARR